MLSALNTHLRESYAIDLGQINRESTTTPRPNLYITSYSEGGGYALKASQLIQGSYANIVANTGLHLKRTIGISGAYDLTHQMLPFAFSDTTNGLTHGSNQWSVSPGCDPHANIFSGLICSESTFYQLTQAAAQYQIATSKPSLAAYMVNAMVNYDYSPAAYNLVMVPAFAQQSTCMDPTSLTGTFSNTTCAAANAAIGYPPQSYTVQQLFNTVGINPGLISDQLFLSAAGSTGFFTGNNTNFLALMTALESGKSYNSVGSFIYPSLETDPGITALVANADTYSWTTTSPVDILYIKYDSTVTNLNSKSACGYLGNYGLKNNSAPGMVACTEVDNSNLWADETLGGSKLPIYMNHSSVEVVMHMVALNKILNNN